MEFQKKYRPPTLDKVIGQPVAVKILTKMLESEDGLPHTIGLYGPSGCGKTTIGRCLRKALNCSRREFIEVNCADTRGIDLVRSIRQTVKYRPLGKGKTMMWLLDECHKLTNDAQTAFLKLLEDTPRHCYFLLATTHKQGLIPTVRSRCTPIELGLVPNEALKSLIKNVLKLEKADDLSKEVLDNLVNVSEGSPRVCLVNLEKIINLSPEEQLDALTKADAKVDAIELCRALISGKKWPVISTIIKNIEAEHESIRHMMNAYAAKVMLSGGPAAKRAALICEVFADPWYNNPESGLIKSAWEVCQTK